MPTITVKLDKKRADKLTRWARTDKVTKSEIVRELIDRGGRIRTGDDLIQLAEASLGKGWDWREKSVTRPVLLDSSFLISLERELKKNEMGPARRFLPALRGRVLVISIVSIAELLEGSADEELTLRSLQRFTIQGLHFGEARLCALLQRRASRRLGENDAWLVATAETLDADVLGSDRTAFERLGSRYLRFRG